MNLNKKRQLAIRTLGVGSDRIVFNTNNLNEIKEAITKQDIRDLVAAGAIIVRDAKGRRKVVARARRRGPGKVKKKVKDSKGEYMALTRKFRAYIKELLKHEQITDEVYVKLRKEIRAKSFKNKHYIKERIAQLMQK
jgi:large subunit ribosomal protein L19e